MSFTFDGKKGGDGGGTCSAKSNEAELFRNSDHCDGALTRWTKYKASGQCLWISW